MKKSKIKAEYWQKLIDHINARWKYRKGHDYPFTGKDFKDLKHYASYYKEWGMMALYDLFIENADQWTKDNGYSLWSFFRQLPKLLDNSGWKAKAQGYETMLCGSYPEQVMNLFDMSQFTVNPAKCYQP